MSFYISLSGLKAAQTDLSTTANNVANVNSTAFKKSKAVFGDIFAAAPMQTTTQVAGQGVRAQGISQQFTQGTIETTDKTLDLAITGEGFFTVKRSADNQVGYTRNGAFSVEEDRYVVDTTGARLQVIPLDPTTGAPTVTGPTAAPATSSPAWACRKKARSPASMPTVPPSIWAQPPSPRSTARKGCARAAMRTGPRPTRAARRCWAPAIAACSDPSDRAHWNAPTSTSPRNWST